MVCAPSFLLVWLIRSQPGTYLGSRGRSGRGLKCGSQRANVKRGVGLCADTGRFPGRVCSAGRAGQAASVRGSVSLMDLMIHRTGACCQAVAVALSTIAGFTSKLRRLCRRVAMFHAGVCYNVLARCEGGAPCCAISTLSHRLLCE